jgi:uncharacterized RDD family membrane protein YckC
MFTILGGDGHEYGPASTEQVRAWVAAGRANLDTKAKAAGTDEWRRLGFGAPSDVPPLIVEAAADANVAERWRRFVGALADGFLEMLAWIPTSTAMLRTTSEMVNAERLDPQEFLTAFKDSMHLSLPYLAALVLLQAVLLTARGQSVGNMLVRTRIVRADNGAPGGFLRAFLLRGCLARAIRHIPLLGGIFWIVDSCFIFRDDKRCLHDLIAGTKVLKM